MAELAALVLPLALSIAILTFPQSSRNRSERTENVQSVNLMEVRSELMATSGASKETKNELDQRSS